MQLGIGNDPNISHGEVETYECIPVGNASPFTLPDNHNKIEQQQKSTGNDRVGEAFTSEVITVMNDQSFTVPGLRQRSVWCSAPGWAVLATPADRQLLGALRGDTTGGSRCCCRCRTNRRCCCPSSCSCNGPGNVNGGMRVRLK